MTPTQMRMARAAMQKSTKALGDDMGVSANAISRFERGDTKVMSLTTINRAIEYFNSLEVWFGPEDGVCVGQNAFATERWFSTACYKLLEEAGIQPSSSDLIDAHKRAFNNGN